MDRKKANHGILILCVLYFIISLHYTLPIYMFSSFLSEWMDSSRVGIIYIIGAILTTICLVAIIPLLKRFGNFKVTLSLILIEFLSLLGLSYAPSALPVFIIFITSFVSVGLIWFTLDIFLEHFSRDSRTGNIRGAYLTVGNLAWIVGPATAAFILASGGFEKVFLISSALLLPAIFLLRHSLSDFKDPEYKRMLFWQSVKEMWRDKDIKGIFFISLLLNLFFAWMVIYTPIYLHQYIGFNWGVTGIILSLALIPFVLVDLPLGLLADRKLGEKEILIGGFIIMALSTMAISLLEAPNALLWAALLFVTRIGAASVEVMSDTYFFKKVDASRVNLISLYRMTRPMSYIIAPALATVVFIFIDIRATFFVLGLLMLFGLRYSLSIKDTL